MNLNNLQSPFKHGPSNTWSIALVANNYRNTCLLHLFFYDNSWLQLWHMMLLLAQKLYCEVTKWIVIEETCLCVPTYFHGFLSDTHPLVLILHTSLSPQIRFQTALQTDVPTQAAVFPSADKTAPQEVSSTQLLGCLGHFAPGLSTCSDSWVSKALHKGRCPDYSPGGFTHRGCALSARRVTG